MGTQRQRYGYISNKLIDAMTRCEFTAREFSILLALICESLGRSGSRSWKTICALMAAEIVHAANLNAELNAETETTAQIIQRLERRGVITSESTRNGRYYTINPRTDEWSE